MATAQQRGMLTQGMSPEQARLLDQQMRQKQFQGRNFGGGALGGFLTSASGAMASAANAGQGLGGMIRGERTIGANEQKAIETQQTNEIISQTMASAQGAKQSDRLLDAAEKLEKSGNKQAIMKATQLREQAAALSVQEQQLELQKERAGYEGQRVSIAQTQAQNRAIELQNQKEAREAADELAKKRIVAQTTKQELVIDSEGNRFNMITTEGGGVSYIALGDAKKPSGNIMTVNEANVNNQIKARNDLEFNKKYLKEHSEIKESFQDTRKVFNSANTAYALLQELQKAGGTTGGIVAETERKIKRYLGIADKESIPAELLKKELGMAIAANLKATFGGSQITDSERKFLEANMISIEDTPEVIMRKLEASMEVSKRGLEKLTKLQSAKGYTELVEIQSEYMQQDYLDVQEKYNLTFGQEERANALQPQAPEAKAAQRLLEQRKAQQARSSRRGAGARASTSF